MAGLPVGLDPRLRSVRLRAGIPGVAKLRTADQIQVNRFPEKAITPFGLAGAGEQGVQITVPFHQLRMQDDFLRVLHQEKGNPSVQCLVPVERAFGEPAEGEGFFQILQHGVAAAPRPAGFRDKCFAVQQGNGIVVSDDGEKPVGAAFSQVVSFAAWPFPAS